MDGLAGQMAQQPQQALPQEGGGAPLPSVEEVIALLMEGVPPEELLSMGIPEQLIVEAITILEQQMATQQQAVPPGQQGGLAAQSVGA